MTVINTLKERIQSYAELTDFKLMQKLPIITIVNGRSFKKITSLLDKPFSLKFVEMMSSIMIKLMQETDGSTFGYSFNDEAVIISRNDQTLNTEAWYDGKIQSISSVSSAIATSECDKFARTHNINLFGDPVFVAKTFVVPNITEAINVLVGKQQQAFHTALHNACFYELLKRDHDPETIQQTLLDKSPQAKADILIEQCDKNFTTYDLPFQRGVAAYRTQKIMHIDGVEKIKNKLTIDVELPIFTREHDFLGTIFRSGRDIFRAERDV